MFVALAYSSNRPATQIQNAERILSWDAATASYVMEAMWSSGGPGLLTGGGTRGPLIATPPAAAIGIGIALPATAIPRWSWVWNHLIYAYMIENTRAYEIMGRVIFEHAHGERLGVLRQDASYQWLRTTEELFYKDASPFQPFNLVSRIRPDIAATRRNAYYRMFGMDLNHGRDGTSTYPYIKPPVANREFIATFEEFLREVWRAIENANNTSGRNPTDWEAIQDLALRLQNMLNARRGGEATRANLAREEFLAVSMASWLHLTLNINSPIVQDLNAIGPSPEERLRQIGERVGLPSHGRSHNYFLLAPRVSTLLISIEQGTYNTLAGAQTLAAPGTVRDLVAAVVQHWSLISGRDLKSRMVTATPSRPVAAPAPTAMPSASPAALAVAPAGSAGNGMVVGGSP
jgi:hypothetical protein